MPEVVHTMIFSAVGPAIARVQEDHKGVYEKPWWGEKNTAHIKNLGYVIGFMDPERLQRWRLDYDPHKGLHINWVRELPGADTEKEAYRIKLHIINGEDEMFHFFRTWTMHYCGECPEAVREKIGKGKIWRGAFWA